MTLEEIRELVSQSQAADNEAVALHKDFRSKVNTPLEAEAWIKLNAATRNCAVLDDRLLGMTIESVVYAADEAIAEARKQAFLEVITWLKNEVSTIEVKDDYELGCLAALGKVIRYCEKQIKQQENDPWLDEPWTEEELKSFDNLENAEEWK